MNSLATRCVRWFTSPCMGCGALTAHSALLIGAALFALLLPGSCTAAEPEPARFLILVGAPGEA